MKEETTSNQTTVDRPASVPTKCKCVECGRSFTGENWNILCRVCVELIACEIAKEQAV